MPVKTEETNRHRHKQPSRIADERRTDERTSGRTEEAEKRLSRRADGADELNRADVWPERLPNTTSQRNPTLQPSASTIVYYCPVFSRSDADADAAGDANADADADTTTTTTTTTQ
jgi:hypothetical protein